MKPATSAGMNRTDMSPRHRSSRCRNEAGDERRDELGFGCARGTRTGGRNEAGDERRDEHRTSTRFGRHRRSRNEAGDERRDERTTWTATSSGVKVPQ